jgi:hypothetical protein
MPVPTFAAANVPVTPALTVAPSEPMNPTNVVLLPLRIALVVPSYVLATLDVALSGAGDITAVSPVGWEIE